MDNTRLTIACEENQEGGYDIDVSFERDYRLFTDREIDSMFEFKELYTIRRFAEIAGVKFDESKFTNRKEFQEYFQKWLKEDKK